MPEITRDTVEKELSKCLLFFEIGPWWSRRRGWLGDKSPDEVWQDDKEKVLSFARKCCRNK